MVITQIGKQVNDLRLNRDIQRRDGFVGNNKIRVENQRSGDADTLALAAGKLMGKRL